MPRSLKLCLVLLATLTFATHSPAQSSESSSSNSPKHIKKPASTSQSGLDPGTVTNSLYRNKMLAMSCKIPAGWVLRTDDMNAPEDDSDQKQGQAQSKDAGRVLLAAFSRPPAAHGEEVNSSIVIAAESVSTYPGLKEAAQYFEPLTEVAKAQGFTADEDPYEIAMGEKVLVRADFHKDVGSRVMHQSTLVFLSHGYAISITAIGGTEDEVEELLDGVDFAGK